MTQPNDCHVYNINYIWRTAFTPGILGNVEYAFAAIIVVSTLIRSGGNW